MTENKIAINNGHPLPDSMKNRNSEGDINSLDHPNVVSKENISVSTILMAASALKDSRVNFGRMFYHLTGTKNV